MGSVRQPQVQKGQPPLPLIPMFYFYKYTHLEITVEI